MFIIKLLSQHVSGTGETHIISQIKMRKRRCVGHTVRKEDGCIEKTSTWNPRGARKTGRPKQTLKKNVLVEQQEDVAKHEVRLRGWWVTVSDKGASQMPYVPNGRNGYYTTTTTTLNRLLITSDIKRLLADGTGIRPIRK